MADQLTEISREDLPLLRDLYKPSTARNQIAYTTIDTYIRWIQQDPGMKHIKIYCLNGDFSRGTFVVVILPEDFSSSFAIKRNGIEILLSDWFLNYYLPKEKTKELNLQIPDEIELKRITKRSYIEKTHSAWPFRNEIPLQFFMRLADLNPSIGAFTKDGSLVAWVYRYPTGLLSALQTEEKYFGRGYASLVTKAIIKQISELGHDTFAGISEKNIASRNLFEKLGYKVIGTVHWMCTKLHWPEDD